MWLSCFWTSVNLIQQRVLRAGGLIVWRFYSYSWVATGAAFVSCESASAFAAWSQWQEWEQEPDSGGLLNTRPGSSSESVGGGEGESVPGSSQGSPLKFWTFLLSSLRSTFSARRSLSSLWTLPWSASKSRSWTDFCNEKHRHQEWAFWISASTHLGMSALYLFSHLQQSFVAALPSGTIHGRLLLKLFNLFSHLYKWKEKYYLKRSHEIHKPALLLFHISISPSPSPV